MTQQMYKKLGLATLGGTVLLLSACSGKSSDHNTVTAPASAKLDDAAFRSYKTCVYTALDTKPDVATLVTRNEDAAVSSDIVVGGKTVATINVRADGSSKLDQTSEPDPKSPLRPAAVQSAFNAASGCYTKAKQG